jgi:hypothetical protein
MTPMCGTSSATPRAGRPPTAPNARTPSRDYRPNWTGSRRRARRLRNPRAAPRNARRRLEGHRQPDAPSRTAAPSVVDVYGAVALVVEPRRPVAVGLHRLGRLARRLGQCDRQQPRLTLEQGPDVGVAREPAAARWRSRDLRSEGLDLDAELLLGHPRRLPYRAHLRHRTPVLALIYAFAPLSTDRVAHGRLAAVSPRSDSSRSSSVPA